MASNFYSCDKLTDIENIARDFGQLCLRLWEKLSLLFLRFSDNSITIEFEFAMFWIANFMS